MLTLLLACSDYELKKGGDIQVDTGRPEETPPGDPDLDVDPTVYEAAGHCSTATVDITLENVGDGDLTVEELALEGDGWVLTGEPSVPFVLQPGESELLTAAGVDGTAVLTVVSDDPDEPEQTVLLDAVPNEAPSLEITAPTPYEILAEGGSPTLEATVSDDYDGAETLVVTWTSDVDGLLGSTSDSVGMTSLAWSPSPGLHVLTATVTDSCGETTSDTIGACQQQTTTTESVDLASWNYEGSASWDSSNDTVQLTPPSGNQVGTAFDTTTTTTGDKVTISFQFYMSGGSGADGLAVTALDLDRATGYLGSAGGCLGFGAGSGCSPAYDPLPGWTVEVDNYQNGKWDPTGEDHVAFMFDGDMNGVEAWAALPDMEDGSWHDMSVTVADPRVLVEIDGTTYIDQDISGYYGFPAHVGFSASTGALTNDHRVGALVVTEQACAE